MEDQKNINQKIIRITMAIKDRYPELSKYMGEMRATIPDEENPRVTMEDLVKYHDALQSMLDKYVPEHP
jgi:hypothetical protein